jgi:cytohesin
MFYAVGVGRRDLVEALLNRCGGDGSGRELSNAPVIEKYSVRPLHVAANYSLPDIGALLLDRGAAIDAKTWYIGQNQTEEAPSVTALHIAASKPDYTMVMLLLERGANVSARDSLDETPLHKAVVLNRTDISELLLNNGAPIEARARYNNDVRNETPSVTPLHLASGHSYAATKLLLERGADVSARDHNEMTPLHQAVYNNQTETVAILLNNGASIEAMVRLPDDDVNSGPTATPLLLAANYGSSSAVVKLLLERGANVSASDSHHYNPLHMAVMINRTEIVELLLVHGAAIDARDSLGWTPFHWAVVLNRTHIVDLLLSHGASIEALARWAYEAQSEAPSATPLHFAALSSSPAVVQLLLERGANVSVRDSIGMMPLHRALSIDRTDIVELLLIHGAPIDARFTYASLTPLHAVSGSSYKMVKLLLERGASVSARDSHEQTPLHRATIVNRTDIMELLLNDGAPIEALARYGDDDHTIDERTKSFVYDMVPVQSRARHTESEHDKAPSATPLHFASTHSYAATKLLLDRGANMSARDRMDATPLHRAALYDKVDIVELLVSRGGNVSAGQHTDFGFEMTAFDYAKGLARNGSTAMLELFLSRGWVNLTTDNLQALKSSLVLAGTMERGSRLDALINAQIASDADAKKCNPKISFLSVFVEHIKRFERVLFGKSILFIGIPFSFGTKKEIFFQKKKTFV